MRIADFLDRHADLHPLDTHDDSTSFARGEIDQIAYKLPQFDDYLYVTADSDDDELDALAAHLATTHHAASNCPAKQQLAEFLKNVRDQMQIASDAEFIRKLQGSI